MGFIQTVKNLFRKGGQTLGMVETLSNITDHPRINVDKSELSRIYDNLAMYKGDYPKVKYINSNQKMQERDFFYLNMMEQSAKTMASLVFNEQCEITVAPEYKQAKTDDERNKALDNEANQFIQHVFEHNDFKKNFAKYLEPMFALGGLAVRPYYDTGTGEIEFSWALADSFFPLRNNTNSISEGVITSKSQDTQGNKTYYYTLLEFHEWLNDGKYQITNELYKSDNPNQVGSRVDLKEVYKDLPKSVRLDLTRPNFCYLKPNGFNNINPYSSLGLSLCDNAKPTLKQVNEAYDQYHWEIKMGQRKIIVSDHFINTTPDEQGNGVRQVFDDDTNVFLGLAADMDDMKNIDITHDIRSSQYIESINHFLRTLETQIGFSSGTFSFDGSKGMKTATEVVSENSMTYRTRNSHIVEIEKFIKELVVSVLDLARLTIGKDGKNLFVGELPSFEDINVDFDDGVFIDKNSQIDYNLKAVENGVMSKVTFMMKQYGMSEVEAQEELARINQETLRKTFSDDDEISRVLNDRLLFGQQEV